MDIFDKISPELGEYLMKHAFGLAGDEGSDEEPEFPPIDDEAYDQLVPYLEKYLSEKEQPLEPEALEKIHSSVIEKNEKRKAKLREQGIDVEDRPLPTSKVFGKPTNATPVDGNEDPEVINVFDEKVGDDFLEESRTLTDKMIEELEQDAIALKGEGNEAVQKAMWQEAFDLYSDAIDQCPKVKRNTLATIYNNRALTALKLSHIEVAIQDASKCIRALNDVEDSPSKEGLLVKAYLRRASGFERNKEYRNALKDYQSILEYQPDHKTSLEAVKVLPAKAEQFEKEQTAEMMGKLKDLGNQFLGLFGMSLDGMNMEQQPDGSYSVNMSQ